MSEPAFDPDAFGVFEDDLDPPVRGWRPQLPPLPMVLGVVGGLVVGAGLGIGGGLLARWLTAPPPPPPPDPMVEVTHTVERISVNLRGDGGERILTVRPALVVRTRTPDDLVLWDPALRDAVVTLGSDLTADGLLSRPGRRRFRDELLLRTRLLLDGHEVEEVLLTEMVVK